MQGQKTQLSRGPVAARLLLLSGLAAVALHGAPLTCAKCHAAQTVGQHETGMARALESGERSDILKSHAKLTFQQGPFTYAIEREGSQSWYTVADGKDKIRALIPWAFGLGAAGQTYLYERNGVWQESRVSYYKDADALDLTVGARKEVPRNLDEAAGRELSARGALECFHCHATGALIGGALHTESLTPGVQCERCHEGAQAHVAAFDHAVATKTSPRRLSALSAEELSDFCGQCHRTWAQIASAGPHNVNNVRFQPYRLTNSRCYDSGDARIRCTACHDPHQEVVHTAGFYDARCMACHSKSGNGVAKLCKVSQKDCATCHMPKIEIPEAHNKFTDHWIRVVKAGEYPN